MRYKKENPPQKCLPKWVPLILGGIGVGASGTHDKCPKIKRQSARKYEIIFRKALLQEYSASGIDEQHINPEDVIQWTKSLGGASPNNFNQIKFSIA